MTHQRSLTQGWCTSERATGLIGDVAAPMERARSLEGTGRSLLSLPDSARAHAPLRQALAIYRELGSPRAEQVGHLLSRMSAGAAHGRPEMI